MLAKEYSRLVDCGVYTFRKDDMSSILYRSAEGNETIQSHFKVPAPRITFTVAASQPTETAHLNLSGL